MENSNRNLILISDQIKELERELRVRKSAYSRWVNEGKMKPEVARKQYDAMEAALITLRIVQDGREKVKYGQQSEIFKHKNKTP